MCIFQDILNCRSGTIIGYMAEDELKAGPAPEHAQALRAIANARKLDEIYAICHEQLGDQGKADELRAFMRSHTLAQSPLFA